MPYAQRNYSQLQGGGNGGPPAKYKIAQIGCFLTSFCNLLERFGMPVDPATLNNIFTQRGIYIDVDDGVKDDLGWQSVTAYNGQIVTTVKSGGVTDRNSIVRLDAKNTFGTHFCLVDSIRADGVYILDSYDGVVKHHNAYGPITGWAVYTYNKPQPVGVINVIPDQDNYFGRYRKAMAHIRGRDMSRDEFRKQFVGQSDLTMLEAMLDDPEADRAYVAQQWALANRAAVEKQIADLKTALANEKNKPPQTVIKEVEKIVEKEVIKEVPVAADERAVVEGWFKKIWNSLFKKG
jgi:hypothetical protein